MSGSRFRSSKALQMGLVHEVVSAEELDQRVNEYVSEVLTAAP